MKKSKKFKRPTNAQITNDQIVTALSSACDKLNSDFGTKISFEIDDQKAQVVLFEKYDDLRGNQQTRKTTCPYGYSAVTKLTTLYTQYVSLMNLVPILQGLEEFGYIYDGYDDLFIGESACAYVVLLHTMEEYKIYLTDDEVAKYAKTLERLKSAKQLIGNVSQVASLGGIRMEYKSDGFKMVQTEDRGVIEIPDYQGFTPSHGQYPYDAQTVNAALQAINNHKH